MHSKTGILQRGPVGVVVVLAHAVLIYAIATSLGIVEFPAAAPRMDAVIIDVPEETQSEPVPVIKPELAEPTLDPTPIEDTVPVVEVPVEEPAPAAITAPVSEPSPPQPVGETANMKVDRRVNPVYPSQSRRAGEEGKGVYRVLVDANGRPIEVDVLSSTGFPRLDDAAVEAIRKWVFQPAMQAGQPVQSWTRVQVQFRLEQG